MKTYREVGSMDQKNYKIFIESNTASIPNSPKPKKKKITIIKKKKHRDGSVERFKSQIFKNYGENF